MVTRLQLRAGAALLGLLCCAPGAAAAQTQPLRVSDSGHQLVREDGSPFFWLGDTAWFLFANLDREESTKYLWDRRNKQFTVVQASLLHFDASRPNALGDRPFHGADPRRPNEAYWRHVDFVVKTAEDLGLYMALLPAWARAHVEGGESGGGVELKLDGQKALEYGRWLGERYRERRNLVWVLGGDVLPREHEVHDALARGLAEGAAGGDHDRLLMTYHPPGGTHRPPATSSGEFYHDKPWLDFNMIQSGHRIGNRSYERIAEDFRRSPAKPTLDAEPAYEAHPVVHDFRFGAFNAWHLRRRAYWSLLAGAFGFTYGGNGVWQMDKPGRVHRYTHHSHFWDDALHLEGAGDMAHVRALMESRPFVQPERVPDQSILLSPQGTVDDRAQSARAADRSYWMIYLTSGDSVRVDLSRVSGERVNAWWFNPRTGRLYDQQNRATREPFAVLPARGARWLDPPGDAGEEMDWVLVLDDRSRGYPAPGAAEPRPPR